MNTTVMAEQLLVTATLFRVTAAELRGLAKGPIQTEHDTIVAVEAYLYENLTNPVQSSRPFFLAMQCPLSMSQIIGASTRVPFLVSNCNYPYRPGFLIFRM